MTHQFHDRAELNLTEEQWKEIDHFLSHPRNWHPDATTPEEE